MTSVSSYLHTGLRGTFYFLKRICSTLFLLMLGFLIALMVIEFDTVKNMSTEEARAFVATFIILLLGSAMCWLIFRALHKRWVKRHMKQIRIDFLEELHMDNVISMESLNAAREILKRRD